MSEDNNLLINNIELLRDMLVDFVDNNESFTDIQKKIIYGRFGLDGGTPKKIKELSQQFEIAPALMKKQVDNLEKQVFNRLKKFI